MPRDAETTNAYLHEFFNESEEKSCPARGCNTIWYDVIGSKGARGRIHTDGCDYLRWIDDEEMKANAD